MASPINAGVIAGIGPTEQQGSPNMYGHNITAMESRKHEMEAIFARIARDALNYAYGECELLVMLAIRMRWSGVGQRYPHAGVSVLREGDRVVTTVLNADQPPVVIEEPYALYPSDALVTQLRLLEK